MNTTFTTAQAASLLQISPRTLERHRLTGTGPRFKRIGRLVRYAQSDLEDFLEASTRSSTSDTTNAREPR